MQAAFLVETGSWKLEPESDVEEKLSSESALEFRLLTGEFRIRGLSLRKRPVFELSYLRP
jgi:hypothetical protein